MTDATTEKKVENKTNDGLVDDATLANKPTVETVIELESSQFNWQRALAGLALGFSVIAVIVAGYLWTNLTKFSQQADIQQQQIQLIVSLQQQTQDLQKQIKNIEINIVENTADIQKLSSMKTGNNINKKYLLTEVKHLLLLAQLNVNFAQDYPSTIALLESAQQRLSQQTDPQILKLRQNIATNIVQLKALPQLDKSALLIKLNALSLQIAQLPLTPMVFKLNKEENTTVATEKTGWRKYWQQSLQTLGRLVIIRYREKPLYPLLSPEQRTNLTYIIQTKFSQASWAVIHDNQAVFSTSLEQILQWITQNYAMDTPAVQSIQKEIAALQKTQLNQKKLDFTNDIKIVDDLLGVADTSNLADENR